LIVNDDKKGLYSTRKRGKSADRLWIGLAFWGSFGGGCQAYFSAELFVDWQIQVLCLFLPTDFLHETLQLSM